MFLLVVTQGSNFPKQFSGKYTDTHQNQGQQSRMENNKYDYEQVKMYSGALKFVKLIEKFFHTSPKTGLDDINLYRRGNLSWVFQVI